MVVAAPSLRVVSDISNAKFVNNTASTGAGAINVDGTVKLRGENTFAGNKVGNTLNDINLNQKNGAAKVDVSGTLTLDGGISGAGTTAFADNTKLNITENTTFAMMFKSILAKMLNWV